MPRCCYSNNAVILQLRNYDSLYLSISVSLWTITSAAVAAAADAKLRPLGPLRSQSSRILSINQISSSSISISSRLARPVGLRSASSGDLTRQLARAR